MIEKRWNMREAQAVARVVSHRTCSVLGLNYYITVHHHFLHCHYSHQEAVLVEEACCCTSFVVEAVAYYYYLLLDVVVGASDFANVVDGSETAVVFVPTPIGTLQTCLPLIASSLSIFLFFLSKIVCINVCAKGKIPYHSQSKSLSLFEILPHHRCMNEGYLTTFTSSNGVLGRPVCFNPFNVALKELVTSNFESQPCSF